LLVRHTHRRTCPPVILAGITVQLFYKQSCALQLQIILAPQGGATTNLINQATAGPINRATAMLLFYIINIEKSIKFLSLFFKVKKLL